jgi:phosphatidate cytidylyltransferase
LNELTKRILSGVILGALLLGDLWLGSWWYLGLLLIGGVLVLREYARLVWKITLQAPVRVVWMVFGAAYVGLALYGLWRVRALPDVGLFFAAWLFLMVWATDIGAYVFGRTIGGPKIAPAISPSKTWAGLFGGIVFAAIIMMIMYAALKGSYLWDGRPMDWVGFVYPEFWTLVVASVPLVVLAQAGDFFESWMKRRAGVKDSGTLIPGHGGLFDRVDGLLPVAIVFLPWIGFVW